MRERCLQPWSKDYARYGGAGVRVNEGWAESFEAFLADMGERPPGTTLDRYPDMAGDYEPGNCRWATDVQQQRNRRGLVLLEMDGVTQCMSAWAEQYGIKKTTLKYRLDKGLSLAEAVK